VGQTLTVTGTPILCEHGLHASVRVLDALRYAPTHTRLCRVRVGGEVVIGSDKIAGTRRTVVWALTERQTDRVLRRFACDVAEGALRSARSAGREPDPRSWAAIEVARRNAVGRATDEELAAARDAAWAAWAARDAAWAAAWAASGDAARDAAWAARDAAWAARDAAWAAAWAASGDAAWAAARAAAWAAARDAARDASRAAARDAARDARGAQNRLLARLATAEHRRQP
jgi:hypothetical protein